MARGVVRTVAQSLALATVVWAAVLPAPAAAAMEWVGPLAPSGRVEVPASGVIAEFPSDWEVRGVTQESIFRVAEMAGLDATLWRPVVFGLDVRNQHITFCLVAEGSGWGYQNPGSTVGRLASVLRDAGYTVDSFEVPRGEAIKQSSADGKSVYLNSGTSWAQVACGGTSLAPDQILDSVARSLRFTGFGQNTTAATQPSNPDLPEAAWIVGLGAIMAVAVVVVGVLLFRRRRELQPTEVVIGRTLAARPIAHERRPTTETQPATGERRLAMSVPGPTDAGDTSGAGTPPQPSTAAGGSSPMGSIRTKTYRGDSAEASARLLQADALEADRQGWTPASMTWEGSAITVIYQRRSMDTVTLPSEGASTGSSVPTDPQPRTRSPQVGVLDINAKRRNRGAVATVVGGVMVLLGAFASWLTFCTATGCGSLGGMDTQNGPAIALAGGIVAVAGLASFWETRSWAAAAIAAAVAGFLGFLSLQDTMDLMESLIRQGLVANGSIGNWLILGGVIVALIGAALVRGSRAAPR